MDKENVETGSTTWMNCSYGKEIEQQHNVMKDDRDNYTITRSRSKSTTQHHSWKEEE